MRSKSPDDLVNPAYGFTAYKAEIWAENNTIMFHVELNAHSPEAAEAYCRSTYPNINDIYVSELTNG